MIFLCVLMNYQIQAYFYHTVDSTRVVNVEHTKYYRKKGFIEVET